MQSITTKRLRLTPVSLSDIALYNELLSCPETTRFLPSGVPYTPEQIQQYVENRVAHWQHGFGTFTLSLLDNPTFKIGYAGVEWVADNPAFADIRYGILARENGKGYAFEAAEAVLAHTFKTTTLSTIYGVAVSENIGSIRVLEKLGMTAEPHVSIYDAEGLLTFSTIVF